MNPAVSIAFLVTGDLSPLRFLVYLCGQFMGAFIGSACVYLAYLDALNRFDGGSRQIGGSNGTAGIFATYPAPNVSLFTAFFDQFLGTFLFVILILAITDKKNGKKPVEMQAVLVGISCLIVASSYGSNCGGAINPFRDLVPRLFTAISGWGFGVFTADRFFFFIPIVAPLAGGAFSAVVYAFLIRNHWPDEDDEDESQDEPEKRELLELSPLK
jgi:aquaporin-7